MLVEPYLRYYVLLNVLLYKFVCETCVSNFNGQSGVLETWAGTNRFPRTTINCTWTIVSPPRTITTMQIERIVTGNCTDHLCRNATNLIVSAGSLIYRNSCCNGTKPDKFSTRQSPVLVSLSTPPSAIKYRLHYSFRNSTTCGKYDFECADKHGCYNESNICDGTFDCHDHSDEVDCGGCSKGYAPCNHKTKHCFDPSKERCDGYFHCPKGEDEGNCSIYCGNGLNCFNSTDCFEYEQRCDGEFDCPNGADELYCPNIDIAANQEKKISLIIVLGVVLSTAFVYLIWRWFLTRRNIDDLMNNMPQMPLPPFRGPGERDECVVYNIQYSDSDYMHGGEIYEAYVRTRRRMGNRARARRCHNVRERQRSAPPPTHFFEYDTECAAVALASLGISPHICIGLSKQSLEDHNKPFGDASIDWAISGQEMHDDEPTKTDSGNSHDEEVVVDDDDGSRVDLDKTIDLV